jgi:membrane protease YdiL (CAAX protease family)
VLPTLPAPPRNPVIRWPLDESIAATRQRDQQPWGARPIVLPIAFLAGIVVVGSFVTHYLRPDGDHARLVFAVVVNVVAEGLLGFGIWLGGREIAARNGGWAAFGWRRPQPRDLWIAGLGIVFAFLVRVFVAVWAGLLTHGRAVREAQNLQVDHVRAATVILLIVVVVICAPVFEELMFRGLILRTLMRRWGFWPAAIVSTTIFAGFHTYEVSTLLGAIVLALSVAGIGATNCLLVRYTDRLAPGVLVHAALNGLAVAVLVTGATG